jgi:hypothetical protein
MHLLLGGGVGLGQDGELLARNAAFQGFAAVRMRAVLIGGIPESNALIVSGLKQVGDAVKPELAGLVGTAAYAVCACAHGEAADGNPHRPEQDAIAGEFRGCARVKVIRKAGKSGRAGHCGTG